MTTITRLYRHNADAHAARDALLEAGVSPDAVSLSVQGDEAGAIKGNFIAGNSDDADFTGNEVGTYDGNFDQVEFGAIYLLGVEIDGGADAQEMEAIMERFGGETPDVGGRLSRNE